jgi:aspartyl protease family protein
MRSGVSGEALAVNLWVGIGLLVVALIVLLLQYDATAIAGMDRVSFAKLMAGVALLMMLGGGLLAFYRDKAGEAFRHILGWAVIFLVLLAGYAYREELRAAGARVASELLNDGGIQRDMTSAGPAGHQEVRIRRISNGYFIAQANLNKTSISMIVDTGASSVVLRPEDARRAGIDTQALHYNVPVQTANGQTMAARVHLDHLAVGVVRLTRVEALITRPGTLHKSLLGMTFLSRLRSYEFQGEFLTLRG